MQRRSTWAHRSEPRWERGKAQGNSRGGSAPLHRLFLPTSGKAVRGLWAEAAPTIPPYTRDPRGSWVHPHSCRGLRGPRLPPHLPVSSLALPGPAPLGSDGVRWFSHGPKWRLIRRRNLLPIKKPAQSPQTACPPQIAFPSPRGTISGSSLGKRVGSHGLPLPASKSTTSH